MILYHSIWSVLIYENNLGTASFVSEFSVMDPPIEIDVRPPETPSTVANDQPDNAGWIYIYIV